MKKKTIIFLLCFTIIIIFYSLDKSLIAVDCNSKLVVIMDADYTLSHGWGHVFRCRIKKILRGRLYQKGIFLNVYGHRNISKNPGGLLNAFHNYKNLTATFCKSSRKYGPPEGFRDVNNIYWELMSVTRKK